MTGGLRANRRRSFRSWASAVAAALVGTLLWAGIVTRALGPIGGYSDYRVHARLTKTAARGQDVHLPHPLYGWLVTLLHRLNPGWGLGEAGVVLVLLSQAALLLLIARLLHGALGADRSWALAGLGAGLAVALTFVNPLNQATPNEIYFGYIFTNTFHNPTSLLLRPLALALFLVTLRLWSVPVPLRLVAAATLTVASALAKPSHAICFAPAVGLLLLWEMRSRDPARGRWAVVLAVLLPAAAVLAWQWWVTTGENGVKTAGIVWAPLKVVFQHTRPNVALLVAKLVLSIVFPLTVALTYFREAARDLALRLAWLSFAFGVLFTYGFVEAGPRWKDGNFLWSGQVTSIILFVASMAFFLRMSAGPSRAPRGAMVACAVAFLLHLASGIAYFIGYLRWERII